MNWKRTADDPPPIGLWAEFCNPLNETHIGYRKNETQLFLRRLGVVEIYESHWRPLFQPAKDQ